jgi:methylmalonyl-CoA mutase cobalamin-binding subunit
MSQLRSKHAESASAADGHPIAVVAERTGLSQDVLRVWERRYQAVEPRRDRAGQRIYSDADLRRLRLLHAATRGGRAIGSIARLSEKALLKMVTEDAAARAERALTSPPPVDATEIVNTALKLTRSLEPGALDGHLRRAIMTLGLNGFLERVAVPLLRRIGDEWHAGRLSPALEHFGSSTLYDIIVERMRSFAPRPGAPSILIATPAGERHAIGAALVGAHAAVEGWRVIYLGADLPAGDIVDSAIATDVDIVALSVLYVEDAERVIGEILDIRARLPHKIPLFVGGAGAMSLKRDLTMPGIYATGNVEEIHDRAGQAVET